MKKTVAFLIILSLLSLNSVFAAELEVQTEEVKDIILVEDENSAMFILNVKNNDISDSFEIYSLVGVSIYPKETFPILEGQTKRLEIEVVPHTETIQDFRGFYAFEYEIKGQQTGFFKDRLSIKIVELEDIIDVKAESIQVESEKINFIIENKEEIELENVSIIIESPFFDFEDTMNFRPYEAKKFAAPIKKDETRALPAGEYDIDITLEKNNLRSKKFSTLNFLESGTINEKIETKGLLIRKKTIAKTNEGNTESSAFITDKKNVLSRLFTTFSDAPLNSERQGFFMHYSWQKDLSPGEEFSITTTTNYTLPFIILVVVIALILAARFLVSRELLVRKNLSLVKTKGGEFALKVKVRIKSNKHLKDLKISDQLPRLTKLYKNYGTHPDEINKETRTISWNLSSLRPGEERIFTYIIYSKLNVFGRFELPAAKASYKTEENKHQIVFSNKVYFAAEEAAKEEED